MSDTIWPPATSTDTMSNVQLQNLTYTDSDNKEHPFPSASHGFGVVQRADGTIVDATAFKKDQDIGFTNPNLHRRIDPDNPPELIPDPNYHSEDDSAPVFDPEYNLVDYSSVDRSYLNKETSPREFDVEIQGTNSYRTTTYHVHNEESITDEIP